MKMNAHALIYLFIILLYSSQIGNSISESVARNDELLNDSMFLDSIASDTWNYLYSANTRSETASLPYSWYSGQNQKVGNFSNPAEIGFYALSWIAAFDLHRPWSPSWTETEENVTKILDQLIAWQNSNNSYKNRVFYQWYWVDHGEVSKNPDDKVVPSIDNAWLAMSLITIREYSKETRKTDLESKCNTLLSRMNFTEFWYHPQTHRFTLGGKEDPQAGIEADYFSNENRIINFVSRALGQIGPDEFNLSLNALDQHKEVYCNITVDRVNWNGAYFTYASPALFINEIDTSYGHQTLIPATEAQIKYANDQNYSAWGLSDCFGLTMDQYIANQGAPPKGMGNGNTSETMPGLIAPYSSALALMTPLKSAAIANLRHIKQIAPQSYDMSYGFHDSVMVDENTPEDYGNSSEGFSVLAQEWTFLSIANCENGFIWRYFNNNSGVKEAYKEMYN